MTTQHLTLPVRRLALFWHKAIYLIALCFCYSSAQAAAPRSQQGAVGYLGGVTLNGPFATATAITSMTEFRVLATAGPLYAALVPGTPMAMAGGVWHFVDSGRMNGFRLWTAGDFSFDATSWASYNRNSQVIDIIAFQGFDVRTEWQIINAPINGVYPVVGRTLVPEGGGTGVLLLLIGFVGVAAYKTASDKWLSPATD